MNLYNLHYKECNNDYIIYIFMNYTSDVNAQIPQTDESDKFSDIKSDTTYSLSEEYIDIDEEKKERKRQRSMCFNKNVLCIIVIVFIIEIGLSLISQHTHVSVCRLSEQ